MFEDVRTAWDNYLTTTGQTIPQRGDPRLDLAAEIFERLVQLDFILEKVEGFIAESRSDPEEFQARLARAKKTADPYTAGEITREEFELESEANSPSISIGAIEASRRQGTELRLFTESFYCMAWRVGGHEILPVDGDESAHWRPTVLPMDGRWFWPR
jgi:hypothetical protein